MRKIYSLFLLLFSLFLFAQNGYKSSSVFNFYENKGQIIDENGKPNSKVKYLFISSGLNVQIKNNGFSYDIYEIEKEERKKKKSNKDNFSSLKTSDKSQKYNFHQKFHRIDFEFLNSNKNVEIVAEEKSPDYENYYNITHKPEGVEKVYRYKKVVYKNLYSNIDLEFFKPEDTLKPVEYNFIIKPNGKVSDIQFSIKGAKTELKNGKISMDLRFGELQESVPSSWFEDGESIVANFKEIYKNIYGFETSQNTYDKTLIIDPVPTRIWVSPNPNGTHSYRKGIRKILTNNNNAIFTLDNRLALYNIATDNYAESVFYSVDYGYLAKFDKNGNKLFGMFMGNHHLSSGQQSTENSFNDFVIDKSNNIYIVGRSSKSANAINTISTTDAHKEVPDLIDSFIMKFGETGNKIWGTFYGGEGYDVINTVQLDSNEDLIIAGATNSSKGIITNNAQELSGYSFISKFSKNGNLIYGSYYNLQEEGIELLDIDAQDNIYFVGTITRGYGSNITGTLGTHLINMRGYRNSFIVKMDKNFHQVWRTYFGGRNWQDTDQNFGNTYVKGLRIDNDGNLILIGDTDSVENIATPNSHQPTYNERYGNDIFLTKFSPQGKQIWGTYFGATTSVNINDDQAYSLDINDDNEILFSGYTSNNIGIATLNGYLNNNNSGYKEGFFTKFSTSGQQIWGSYYDDTIHSIHTKGKFIYTFGHSTLAKFYDCSSALIYQSNSPVCIGGAIQLTASGGATYQWTGPNGFSSTQQNPTITNATILNSGTYSCTITGAGSCDGTFFVEVKVEDTTPPVPHVANLPSITGDCHTIISTIPTAIDNCMGTITATTTDPLIYQIPGTYIINWKYDDGNGNSVIQTQNLHIIEQPQPKVNPSQIFCEIDLPTISDIEVEGNNLKWYDANGNVLSETALLVDNVKYFVTQQSNGCESVKAEILVKINKISAPSTIAIQEFCEEQKATVKNLYAEGQNIKWYDDTNTILSQDKLLKNGELYYVSQTINGCESAKRSEVLVRLTKDALKANDYSDSKCNIELQSLNVNLDDYREKLISNFNSYNFEYFDNGFNKINSINALNFGINQFNVKISNSSGCFTYVQLTIHFFELPKINLPSEIKICKDEVVELDAGVGFSSYEWNTGENSQKIFVNKSGRYDLKVTNSNGCVALHQIHIVEKNVGEISAIKIENNSAEIAMSTSGDYLYTIDPIGVVWQDSNVFKNLKNGNHRLKVKTKEGCYVDERVFTIFSIVDSFSPNGDGINDYWEISGLENYTGTKINVVDRFGKNVMNVVSNGQFKWDGKLNGRPLPTGVYWYVISISDGRVFTGSLTLKNRN